jgi:hypothetical protein
MNNFSLRACPQCQKEFRARVRPGRGIFCSKGCAYAARSAPLDRKCLECARPIATGKFCSLPCRDAHHSRPGVVAMRFWAKVNRDGPRHPSLGSACWNWTAARDKSGHGYGKFQFGGRLEGAHRVSFFLEHGRWPASCCLHRCDNRQCVRPSHLFEGTVADNHNDMREKGREPAADRHGRAKLRAFQVLEIRAALSLGEPRKAIASRYSVGLAAIGKIARGEKWKTVREPA